MDDTLNRRPNSHNKLVQAYCFVRAVLFSIFIFLPLLVINVMQAAVWLVTPLFPAFGDRASYFFADSYWSFVVWVMERVQKIELDIRYEPGPFPPGEKVLMSANHQSHVDSILLLAFAKRQKALGALKFFVKDELKYVPGPGWGMYFLGCVFLKRNWQDDAAGLRETFARYKRSAYPVWIHIFTEGTRRTPAKQALATKYALEKRQKPLTRVLWPRTKGFVATLQGMGQDIDAVYDLTIIYPTAAIPTLWDVFMGELKEVKIIARRTPARELPEDPGALSEWLVDSYYQKEETMQEALGPA